MYWGWPKRFAGVLVAGLAGFGAGCSGGGGADASFDPEDLALVRIEPGDGESAVARNDVIRIIFSTTVDPDSVTDQSILVRTGANFQSRPKGAFLISGNVIEFDPTITQAREDNASGFEAGIQIRVEIPLHQAGDNRPATRFVKSIEGNPIALSLVNGSTASSVLSSAFTTGSGWNDPNPGPPGIVGLEFTPGPNGLGQIPSDAAVTMEFSEPINPATFALGENVFLTNATATSPAFQDNIPSAVFFDGSLKRVTMVPVFGFGQGPFKIQVNFIDPTDPTKFTPGTLPRDLAGNSIQNFTFLQTFTTAFNPNSPNTGVITEAFDTTSARDPALTDAVWSDDATFPFSIVSQPITTRLATVDVRAITAGGIALSINRPQTAPSPSPPLVPFGRVIGEEDYCPGANPLIGPDLPAVPPNPPTAAGRRQLNLYRQTEVGGAGTIIRAGWGPESDATFATTYPSVTLRLGHKKTGTGFATGGLSDQFDVNGFVTVVNPTGYSIAQSAEINGGNLNDGFQDWPAFDTFFAYDGVNDLIVDVEASEGGTFQTSRNFLGVTQVGGAPTCNCITIFTGSCNQNTTFGLRRADGIFGSNALVPAPSAAVSNPSAATTIMEFELAKLRSVATSRYYDTGVESPDFFAPLLRPTVQDGGASVTWRWSGSADGIVDDVPFTQDINAVDGLRFIRYEAVLNANFFTGARAVINRLEIPFTIDD